MKDKNIKKTIFKEIIYNLDELIGYMMLFIVVSFTAINVILRYFFGFTISAAEEIALIGFIWASYLGVAAAYKAGEHIEIDVVVDRFPKKIRSIIEILVDVLIVFVSLAFTYLGIILTTNSGGKSTYVMSIPYIFVNSSIVICFSLLSIYGMRNLLLKLKNISTIFKGSK